MLWSVPYAAPRRLDSLAHPATSFARHHFLPRRVIIREQVKNPNRDHTSERLVVGVDVRPLADPHLRGFGRYTHEIARALAERPNLEVTGFTDLDVVHDTPIPIVRYRGGHESTREQWTLPRVLARNKVDVFLCPANRGLPFAAPCPTVLTLHDAVEWDRSLVEAPHGKSRFRFVYASAASMSGASLIVTVSRSSAEAIVQTLGVSPRRIRVTYEAADQRFRPQRSPEDDFIRRSLGLSRSYVLYVGGFDRKKDLQTLVRAFALVAEQTDVDLVLAGRCTDDANAIIALTQELGIGLRSHFPGYVREDWLPALYRGARCFAFPALAEGFGLPALEAMASGVPLVAAAAGSLPEIVAEGGQLVEPGDPPRLAVVLHNLLSDADQHERWTRAALCRAAAFSWEQTGEQSELVLREAAADRPLGTYVGRLFRFPGTLSHCLRPNRTSPETAQEQSPKLPRVTAGSRIALEPSGERKTRPHYCPVDGLSPTDNSNPSG